MIRLREPGSIRLAVMASGRGSNFDALYNAIQRGDLDARLLMVLSDNPGAPVLDKAAERGVPARVVDPKDFKDRNSYEGFIISLLGEKNIEIIALAGYMRLVGPRFLQAFPNKIINIHPALLPAFTGLHAQKQAVDYGVRFSGCTVHIVDQGMDTGPIILQEVVPVLPGDDEESLSQRILIEEHKTYWKALQLMAEGRIFLDGRKVIIS